MPAYRRGSEDPVRAVAPLVPVIRADRPSRTIPFFVNDFARRFAKTVFYVHFYSLFSNFYVNE
jgi:hypothetical protein